MDTFLESYGLAASTFRSLLIENDVLFSGSAALALYLQQIGLSEEKRYEPNDIDIWMNSSQPTRPLSDYFLLHGYHLTRRFDQPDHYVRALNKIVCVTTFHNIELDKKIQLITIDHPNLLEYIAEQFDLSACMTWWNGIENVFETLYPSLTARKQMFVRRSFISNIDQGRFQERLQKYIQRGFEVVQEPPPFINESDPRSDSDLSELHIQAFDVWQYEEIDGIQHLKDSPWNILLRVGENWYSFERKAIGKYLEDHRLFHPQLGSWYETPYRQAIPHSGLSSFYYSDFSIYRLVDPFVLEMNHASRTVYSIEAYSIADWIRGSPTQVYEHNCGIFLSHPMDQIDQKNEEEEDEDEEEEDDIEIINAEIHVIEELLAFESLPSIDLPSDQEIDNAENHLHPHDQELHQEIMEWLLQSM